MTKLEQWDNYFLGICEAVAQNSKCLSRQIGAILVKDKSIISTGYNGPPRGVKPCSKRQTSDPLLAKEYDLLKPTPSEEELLSKCPRRILGFKSGQGLEWCVAGHAERNALINAAKQGISTNQTTMYMNCLVPCSPCLIEIINAGVDEIVVVSDDFYDTSAKYLLKESGLKARLYGSTKHLLYPTVDLATFGGGWKKV